MIDSVLARLIRDHPIVITGTGSFSAAGDSVESLWRAAVAGRSLAVCRPFPMGNASEEFAVCSAPELDVHRSELQALRKTDRCVQLAWLAANQAWQQAQLDNVYAPERIGVMVGSSRGPSNKRAETMLAGRHKYPPSLSANTTFAVLSGALAQTFKLKGPGATISATCASSAFAIGLAAEQILLGKVDAMLVGGAETPLQPAILAQLQSAGVMAVHQDAAQACRPFDQTRNGLVLGEGSAFLILESAHTAAKRGAKVLAQLAGWSLGLDDSGRTGADEAGSGLIRMMEQALQLADLTAEKIGYINAHGTGTKLNDAAEAQAVGKLFGPAAAAIPCSSTKPITGHCLGATPALEAIICLEALRHGMIPPTANCRQQDPLCAINVQPLIARPAKLSTVMSNSLGFWGYQASLIFQA